MSKVKVFIMLHVRQNLSKCKCSYGDKFDSLYLEAYIHSIIELSPHNFCQEMIVIVLFFFVFDLFSRRQF